MSKAASPSLADLRAEIDKIDVKVHELLRLRAQVVTHVAKAKAAAQAAAGEADPPPAFRAAREAEVLRELADRHDGPFPLTSLVRIWREIISGMTRIQQDVVVAAHRPEKGDGAGWDAARDHFGLGMTYLPMRRARDVVAAVRDRRANVGVLPAPGEEDGEEPWWPALAADSEDLPRIVVKLPFLRPANSGASQVAIALPGPEPEAHEAVYLALEAAEGASRERVAAALAEAGVAAGPLLRPGGAEPLYLAEALSGWPARLSEAAVSHVVEIGGYPIPIPLD